MPIAKVRLEDGRIARLEVPEGTTPEQVMAFVQNMPGKQAAPRQEKMSPLGTEDDTLQIANPFGSNFDTGIKIGADRSNFLAGAGKSFADTAQGVRNILGKDSTADVEERRRLDAPLVDTGAGIGGNIVGGISQFIPAMFMPGANSAVGTGLIGATMGALSPVGEGESRSKNTALGGLLSYAGHKAVSKALPAISNFAKGKISQAVTRAQQMEPISDAIKAAQNLDYKLPPSFSGGGLGKRILEGVAGKASVKQAASSRNQSISEGVVRKALGLAKDQPISPATLEGIKKQSWGVYEQARNLGTFSADKQFKGELMKIANVSGRLGKNSQIDDLITKLNTKTVSSDDLISDVMQLRSNASTRLSSMNADPASKALGRAEKEAANALERLMERNIAPKDRGFVQTFRKARQNLARVHDVEDAMEKSGVLDMRKLARTTTGEIDPIIKDAAKFAKMFPELNQGRVSQVIGGAPLDVFGAGALSIYNEDPRYLALAAMRPAARAAVLSGMMKSTPKIGPSVTARLAANIPKGLTSKNSAMLSGLLGPSIYAQE